MGFSWLDRKVGPMRVRAWALGFNMIANGVALYGLSQVLSGQGGGPLMSVGIAASLLLIAIIAVPSS